MSDSKTPSDAEIIQLAKGLGIKPEEATKDLHPIETPTKIIAAGCAPGNFGSIGSMSVEVAAKMGLQTFGIDFNPSVTEFMTQHGGESFVGSITDTELMRKAAEQAMTFVGDARPVIYIPAGVYEGSRPFWKITEEEEDRTYGTNVLGPRRLLAAHHEIIVEASKRGITPIIVFVSSKAAFDQNAANVGDYAPAKAALNDLARRVFNDYRKAGINVLVRILAPNAVCDTNLFLNTPQKLLASGQKYYPDAAPLEAVKNYLKGPNGLAVSGYHVARVFYSCLYPGGEMTGVQTIHVDGGVIHG